MNYSIREQTCASSNKRARHMCDSTVVQNIGFQHLDGFISRNIPNVAEAVLQIKGMLNTLNI